MNPRVYERLYGMRTRLLAGGVALALLVAVLLFRPSDASVRSDEETTPPVRAAELPQPSTESPSEDSPVMKASVPSPTETTVPTPDPEPVVTTEPPTEKSPTYTVQQGDCVWRIAENRCGSGFKWGDVYRANLDRIANPDLIYPDQEFTIPCGR